MVTVGLISTTPAINSLTQINFDLKNRNDELEFDIQCKSISAIIDGLSSYKQKLIEWDKTADDPHCPSYKIDSLVRDSFTGEFTKTGFQLQKEALAAALEKTALEVTSLCYDSVSCAET